jgi:hemoglobin-like flavoprotein
MGSGLTSFRSTEPSVNVYHYIDNITLTKSQITELSRTWLILHLYGTQQIGIKIFKKIFIIAPETFQMFPFADDPNWESSRSFLHHAKIVVNIIGSVITSLKNPILMEKHLHELGLKHCLFKITSQHFDLLGEYFLETIEEILGKESLSYNKKIAKNWKIVYEIISRNIQKSMKYHAEVYHLTPID